MAKYIHHMTVIRYAPDGRHWDADQIVAPDWATIEAAVRRMDNYCFPIVQLNTTESEEDHGIFNVCGGDGRWALFHMMGDWQYEDPGGGEDEVRLWDSDQGYYCRQKNVITDIEKVLRVTKAFYETGSFEGLDLVQ